MLCAYVTHTDCLRHEMGVGQPECPERLSAIRDQLLIKGLLDCMQVVDAPLATDAQLAREHCNGRVISCLEGGYAPSALGRSAAAHVMSLIGSD